MRGGKMDLNMALWAGGMLFSLGAFALKVGLGLGYGRIGIRGVAFTLAGYGALFTILALLAGELTKVLYPLLGQGPYVHVGMAAGLIAWGLYTILKSRNSHPETATVPLVPSLLLVVPCPVCLTAMAVSTWTALAVIDLPSWIVGLGLGIVFAVLALLFLALARLGRSRQPEISLGLVMVVIGFYFIASLSIPARIEEARGVYASFLDRGALDRADGAGALLLLFVAMLAGYFITQRGFKK